MAMRTPSCASRRASPRPIPLLPPVTSATRLRRDIYLPGKISWKDFQYSPANADVLPKPGDDHCHIVGLFRSSGPLLGRGHERLRDHERRGTLQALRRFLQTANSKFFAVDVFRLNQAVTISDEEGVGTDCQRPFLIRVIFHHSQHHATRSEERRVGKERSTLRSE